MDARNSRGSQQLCKTSFARGRSERNSVQQDLRSRGAEKHAAAAAVIQRVAQFFPRRFKLLRGLRVPKLVQTREFPQNVEAAHKRPRPASLFLDHSCRRWTLPLLTLLSTVDSPSPADKPPAAPCTHLNNRFQRQFGNIVVYSFQ